MKKVLSPELIGDLFFYYRDRPAQRQKGFVPPICLLHACHDGKVVAISDKASPSLLGGLFPQLL
jgi:hypothetical protein